METTMVAAVDYRDASISPWPRIVKLLGLFALMYGAADLALTANALRTYWPLWELHLENIRERTFWVVVAYFGLGMGLLGFMVVGAVAVLRFGRDQLLLIACNCLLAFWILTFVGEMFLHSREGHLLRLLNNLIYTSDMYVFPLLIFLLLQARAKEASPKPQPPSAPLFEELSA